MNQLPRIAALLILTLLMILITRECAFETGRWIGAN
jgi:hypothetical protein